MLFHYESWNLLEFFDSEPHLFNQTIEYKKQLPDDLCFSLSIIQDNNSVMCKIYHAASLDPIICLLISEAKTIQATKNRLQIIKNNGIGLEVKTIPHFLIKEIMN